MDLIYSIWNAKVQFVPVIIMITIYILPNEIRKYYDLKYAPIYFAVPPFCNSNILINRYYEFRHDNGALVSNKDEILIKEIKKSSLISLLFEGCLWPVIFGGITGIIMTEETIKQFLIFVFIIRMYQFIKSVIYFHKEEYYTKASEIMLIFVYILFTYVSIRFVFDSWKWVNDFITMKDYTALIDGIIKFILKDFILVGVLGYFGKMFLEALLNPGGKLYGNLYHIQNAYSEDDKTDNNAKG